MNILRRRRFGTVVAACLIAAAANANSKTSIVATLPELGWLASQLTNESVSTLVQGNVDPHYVESTPSQQMMLRTARLLVVNGLDFESSWLPKTLDRVGRPELKPRGSLHCDASKRISPLGLLSEKLTRAHGHLHSAGNPHYLLAPSQMILASKTVAECLATTVPTAGLTTRQQQLEQNIAAQRDKLNAKLKNLQLKKVLQYHQEWDYWLKDYGLESIGSLEEFPGSPPSAARISRIAEAAKAQGAQLLFASEWAPKQSLERFTELSGIPHVQLPSSSWNQSNHSWIDLQNQIVANIEAALQKK